MPRLSTDSQDAKRTSANSSLRARIKRAQKAVLRSYKVNLLKGRDLPIRLRPVRGLESSSPSLHLNTHDSGFCFSQLSSSSSWVC